MRMTRDGARLAIVAFSISMSGVLLVFFLLGPAFGMPFTPGANENLHLTQIVLPVFLGYLGSAVQFIFRSRQREAEMPAEDQRLLFLLVNGPFVLFVIFNLSLFGSFYMRNQLGGSGLTFEELSQWFSVGPWSADRHHKRHLRLCLRRFHRTRCQCGCCGPECCRRLIVRRILVIGLLILLGGMSVTHAPRAQSKKSIEAQVRMKSGQLVTTSMALNFPFDRHAELMKDVSSSSQMDCLLFGFVAKCLGLKHSFYTDDGSGSAYPNDKRVFVHPVSQVAIWLSGRNDDKDFGKLASEVAGSRQPVPVPLVGKPITYYNTIIGNEYFVDTYDTSFEPVGSVQDGALALRRLDDMLYINFPVECPSPDIFHVSMGTYCSGVFRWSSSAGSSGHAWCKYMHSGDVTSAPFDCVALSVTNSEGTYIRAFPTPFYGEGFGQGVGGLDCQGEPSLPYSRKNVNLIIQTLRQPPFEVDFGELGPGDAPFWRLNGERRNVRSPVNQHVFEWTTFHFMAMDDRRLGLSLVGEIVPAVSGTIMASLQQARNLSEADLQTYKEYAQKTLTSMLSAAFQQPVLCTIQ